MLYIYERVDHKTIFYSTVMIVVDIIAFTSATHMAAMRHFL